MPRIIDFADGFESAVQPTAIGVPASDIGVTPAGNISSTDVQSALEELDTEKVAKITSVDNTVPRFDGVDGDVQDSGVVIDDSNNVSGIADLETTGLAVKDKSITVNKDGATASGSTAGISVEENGSQTGYVTTSADRNSWELKPPNTAGKAVITPGATDKTVAFVPASGVVKSDGTKLSSANVDLTSEVANALPITNGGTGQTSATAALNALLPSQTGQATKVFTTDGTNGSWVAPAGGGGAASYPITSSASTTQSIGTTVSGSLYIGTATAAITYNLPAASAVSNGFIVNVAKNASGDITHAYTLTANGSDTIVPLNSKSAASTFALYTDGETAQLVSDGSSKWYLIEHKTETGWSTSQTTTITATTTAPTKGTVSFDSIKWRRVGNEAEVWLQYTQSSVGGVAGNGDYIIALPTGLVFDSSVQPYTVSPIGNTGILGGGFSGPLSGGILSGTNAGTQNIYCLPLDSTHFRVYAANNYGAWGSAANGALNQNCAVGLKFTVPIANWNA